ncbi:YihY/virulence factor BrkB family protein [Pseudooceanicola aestuarii]|uniref:YihY/virulence factor BrkB family protein n=1 Tax=Pseudooceanicola aestuarii TaxID=2697319 RepID=UPI0013D17C43|nr:YihY/virulence factor BrkB family protein [Pseudooceanicola aestuarii]
MRRFLTLPRAVIAQITDTNMALVAAGVAFYGMLALFPGLAATIALWGLISDPAVLVEQIELLHAIVPEEVFGLVEKQITNLTQTSGDRLGWAGLLSLLVAIWSSRSGVASLILGLNMIHGRRNRGSIRHYLTALALTVSLLGVALVALTSVVIAPIVLSFVPLGPLAALLVELIRWVAAIGVLLVGLALIYRYGPNNRGERLRWVTPGAVLAVLVWAVASYGFSLYISNFGRYNEVYGSIGAAVAMLIWLYISAFLILLGASLNVQIKRQTNGSPTAGRAEGDDTAMEAEAQGRSPPDTAGAQGRQADDHRDPTRA